MAAIREAAPREGGDAGEHIGRRTFTSQRKAEDAWSRYQPRCGIGQTQNKNCQPRRLKVSTLAAEEQMRTKKLSIGNDIAGDPGMTRTCDLRFRKPSLDFIEQGAFTRFSLLNVSAVAIAKGPHKHLDGPNAGAQG